MSALEGIGKSLSEALRRLLRLPLVDEKAIRELVKELQRSLLQGDVNVNLVLEVSNRVQDRAINERVPPGVTRREHVVRVLYEELTKFLGEEPAKTTIVSSKMNVVMLVGIQGSGKTSGSVKIGRYFQKRGLKTGLVCADTFRPGAYDQITQLANKVGLTVYGSKGNDRPERIALDGLRAFEKDKYDVVIVDTAGRHKKERDLMEEMKVLAESIKPDEIMLVVDGTIGQQAASQAKAFNEATSIGSIFITKLDGSARGGGALSAVAATGARIKFISAGEKVDDLEQFVPSEFVGRLLGMGDLRGLLEKVKEAEASLSESKAKSFLEGRFTLKDMYEQMQALRRMGPLKKLLRMMPGSYNIPDDMIEIAEKKLDAWRVIIQSMRKDEVENPKIVDSSRSRRIARGSGRSEREVKELVRQYTSLKKMMKTVKRRQATMMRRLSPYDLLSPKG